MKRMKGHPRIVTILGTIIISLVTSGFTGAVAQPLPGGTLDPISISKYVTPLVIPPVIDNDGAVDSYDIAVRQFQQQILPGGIWNTINGRIRRACGDDRVELRAGGGPCARFIGSRGRRRIAPAPNSQFNYPAYTVETLSDVPVGVRWINDLVAPNGDCRPHLLSIDQTLHWANPPMDALLARVPGRSRWEAGLQRLPPRQQSGARVALWRLPAGLRWLPRR